MQTTTMSFANMHNHGKLFANVLRARDEDPTRTDWSMPLISEINFDQYDTPISRWLAVHDDAGRVLAGARLTPTFARAGIYSYMIRDAQRGLIDTLPVDILQDTAPVDAGIWELSRGFITPGLSKENRLSARQSMAQELMNAAQAEGIRKILALVPASWSRWAPLCQLDLTPAGPVVQMDNAAWQAVWVNVATKMH